MPSAYTSAAIPKRFTIFGQTLRPFSPGHFLVLDSLDSAFVCDDPDRPVTLAELILGILICSRTFKEALELVASPDTLKSESERLGAIVGSSVAHLQLDYNQTIINRAHEFACYVTEARKEPEYWIEREGSGAPSGVSQFQAMKLTLCGELGYSNAEFMDAPMQQCIQDFVGHIAQSGAIRMSTEDEAPEIARFKAEREKCPTTTM